MAKWGRLHDLLYMWGPGSLLSNTVSTSVSPQHISVQQKTTAGPTLYLKLGEEDQGGEGEEGGRWGLCFWLGMAVHLAAHAKCLQ